MKTLEFQIPDELAQRLDQLAASQGSDYESVNTSEVKGRDALFIDLLMLGLDEIAAGEEDFPDDVED
jgi:predicted transcriptional regulator